MFDIIVLFAGITLCLYAIYVEENGKNPEYVAVCDISNKVSCTKVLTSEYSHMAKLLFRLDDDDFFNMSNAQYGLIYYIILLGLPLLSFIPYYNLIYFILTLSSVIASVALAAILYYILEEMCIVCITMYVINIILFAYSIVQIII